MPFFLIAGFALGISLTINWMFANAGIIFLFVVWHEYIAEPFFAIAFGEMTTEQVEQDVYVRGVSQAIQVEEGAEQKLIVYADIVNSHPSRHPSTLELACQATDHVTVDEGRTDIGVRDYIVLLNQDDFQLRPANYGTTQIPFDVKSARSFYRYHVNTDYSYVFSVDQNTVYSQCVVSTTQNRNRAIATLIKNVGPTITFGHWRYQTNAGRIMNFY